MVTKGGQMPISFLEETSVPPMRPVMIAALSPQQHKRWRSMFKDLEAIEAASHRGGNPLTRSGLVLSAH
jgi:hypothetical protein